MFYGNHLNIIVLITSKKRFRCNACGLKCDIDAQKYCDIRIVNL